MSRGSAGLQRRGRGKAARRARTRCRARSGVRSDSRLLSRGARSICGPCCTRSRVCTARLPVRRAEGSAACGQDRAAPRAPRGGCRARDSSRDRRNRQCAFARGAAASRARTEAAAPAGDEEPTGKKRLRMPAFGFMKRKAAPLSDEVEDDVPDEEILVQRQRTRYRLVGAAALMLGVIVVSPLLLDRSRTSSRPSRPRFRPCPKRRGRRSTPCPAVRATST